MEAEGDDMGQNGSFMSHFHEKVRWSEQLLSRGLTFISSYLRVSVHVGFTVHYGWKHHRI